MEQADVHCSESEGIVAARADDRRVQRTRQLLQGALLSLIREKGFEALSVQDIIDRANVGRATFYAHFDNKEDLLVSRLDELRASLKERQRQALARATAADERAFAFSHEVFAHAGEHRDVFRAMVGKRSGAVIERLFQRMLVELVREDVKALVPRSASGAAPAEAVVHFVASGLFGLLMWWMDTKMRPSVEDVNALFRRLAIPAVKAAVR
jgi:AcrR family transcriptional regulator